MQFCSASVSHSSSINIRDICPHKHNTLACWIINLLLDVLLCSIAENFFLLLLLTRSTGSSKYGTTCSAIVNFSRHHKVRLIHNIKVAQYSFKVTTTVILGADMVTKVIIFFSCKILNATDANLSIPYFPHKFLASDYEFISLCL